LESCIESFDNPPIVSSIANGNENQATSSSSSSSSSTSSTFTSTETNDKKTLETAEKEQTDNEVAEKPKDYDSLDRKQKIDRLLDYCEVVSNS